MFEMVISRAPMRVSFLGGGSDLPVYLESGGEGRVLSATIDKYVYVVAKWRADKKIVASYSTLETVSHVSELENDYLRATLETFQVEDGIEIASMSDVSIPHSGLGGSSAFLVAIVAALRKIGCVDRYADLSQNLAQTAIRIEREILLRQGGIQDHYAAMYGGFNEFIFGPRGAVFVNPLTMPHDIKSKFLLIRINRQFQEPQTSDAIFKEISDPEYRQRSLALGERLAGLAEKGKRYIDRGDYGRAFGLMRDAWLVKRGLAAAVSNGLVDAIHAEVIGAGATAGKLCGAGGEGHMLFWCPEGREAVIERLQGRLDAVTIVPFGFSEGGVEARFAFGDAVERWWGRTTEGGSCATH